MGNMFVLAIIVNWMELVYHTGNQMALERSRRRNKWWNKWSSERIEITMKSKFSSSVSFHSHQNDKSEIKTKIQFLKRHLLPRHPYKQHIKKKKNQKRSRWVLSQSFTSSCIISQTKLRSATDGWELPSKNFPFPSSQKDSIFDRDENKSFSASAAACGFTLMPSAGPSTVFRRNGAEKDGRGQSA